MTDERHDRPGRPAGGNRPGSGGAAAAGLERARTLLRLGRPEEAIDELGHVLALDPTDAPALATLGLALLRADHPRDALEAVQAAGAQRPAWDWPHRIAAAACARLGWWRDAVHAARTATRLGPHEPLNFVVLAAVLTDAASEPGRRPDKSLLTEARAAASLASTLAPGTPEPLRVMAQIETAEGHADRARELLRTVLQLDPHDSEARTDLAMSDFRRSSGLGGTRALHTMGAVIDVLRAAPTSPDALAALQALCVSLLLRFTELAALVAFVVNGLFVVTRSGTVVGAVGAALLVLALGALAGYGAWMWRRLPGPGRRRLGDFARTRRGAAAMILIAASVIGIAGCFAVGSPESRVVAWVQLAAYLALPLGYNLLQSASGQIHRVRMLLVVVLGVLGLMLVLTLSAAAMQEPGDDAPTIPPSIGFDPLR